jgi:predicted nucleic acid-binding protein
MSYRLSRLVGRGYFEVALSVPLVLEYEDAIKRVSVDTRIADDLVDDILDYYCSVGHKRTNITYLWRPFLKDPRDDHVLELAVAARCKSIVTFNKRDFAGVEQFGVALFTPGEYLKRLELDYE